MADGSSGPSAILGVLIGAIIVIGIMAFAFGWFPGGTRTADVKVEVPSVPAPSAPKLPSTPSK
jgi:hypothetical protein